MPALTSIESGKCGFGDDGVSALMQAAKAGGTPCLRQWYLQGNGFSDAGMEAICEACAGGGLPQLERLNLCSTRVGDEGCLVLANAMEVGSRAAVNCIRKD